MTSIVHGEKLKLCIELCRGQIVHMGLPYLSEQYSCGRPYNQGESEQNNTEVEK
jgi:hypothetical protein